MRQLDLFVPEQNWTWYYADGRTRKFSSSEIWFYGNGWEPK